MESLRLKLRVVLFRSVCHCFIYGEAEVWG